MLVDDVKLTHEQQQVAVERIQELMAQGVSSGEAIKQVADEIRRSQAKSDLIDGIK